MSEHQDGLLHYCQRCWKECDRDEEFCPVCGGALAWKERNPSPQVPALNAQRPPPEHKETPLSKFLSNMGFKKKAPPPEHSWLPDHVKEKGWTVAAPLETSGQYHKWRLVHDNDQSISTFAFATTGVLTSRETLAGLPDSGDKSLPCLHDYGRAPLAGDATGDFILFTLAQGAMPFGQWLSLAPPSEDKGKEVLHALLVLLNKLSEAGVRPITLAPEDIVRYEDGVLGLSHVGALSALGDGEQYRTDLAGSALIAAPWAAPELVDRHVVAPKSVLFSVGQLVAQAIWEKTFSASDLAVGILPVQRLADDVLATALRGTLWPQDEERWSLEQLRDFVANPADRPPLPEWSKLFPGAASHAISFAGKSWYRFDELIVAAVEPQNWEEFNNRIISMLEWAEESSNWGGDATALLAAYRGGKSADWILCQMRTRICPDLPLTWRELDLSAEHFEETLVALAQRAIDGDLDARRDIERLYTADLRGAFTRSK